MLWFLHSLLLLYFSITLFFLLNWLTDVYCCFVVADLMEKEEEKKNIGGFV